MAKPSIMKFRAHRPIEDRRFIPFSMAVPDDFHQRKSAQVPLPQLDRAWIRITHGRGYFRTSSHSSLR